MHSSPAQQPGTGDSGGMNVAIRSIAAQLAQRGIEVELLTRAAGAPGSRELEPGVVLHELAAGPARPLGKGELPSVSDEFGEAVARLAGRRAPRYDLIHAHYWLSGIAALPVALELGLPLVQSFHTLAAMKNRFAPDGDAPEPEIRVRSEAYLSGQASAVIAGSAAEATALVEELRAPPGRVWVIPPGVDVDLFRPNRAEASERVRSGLGVADGRPILAVAGRIQPLKDQELAIRALAELHALRGWSPMLVVAGEATPGDEGYLAGLRSLARELGVAEDIRFVGALAREELAALFAAASLTLVPSHSETFGLVALESAASGTPVVGYRGSGLLESVAEGRSGRLVGSRDAREWAAVLAGLLEDPRALARLSGSAREHALGFTWAASATALLGVYGSL